MKFIKINKYLGKRMRKDKVKRTDKIPRAEVYYKAMQKIQHSRQ